MITLGTDIIIRKRSVKYLGLHIDDGLRFNEHIEVLKKKLSRLAGASYRLNSYFNQQASKVYYYSCVYSLITYCLPVFGGALATQRGSLLIRTHQRIVKNLFKSYSPTECPFKKNKLLKLPEIYKFYAGVHMFKILALGENNTVSDTLAMETAAHDYNTRTRNNLRTPFPRVDAIKRSYKYQFIGIWNDIPQCAKNCDSLKSFKRVLSNYFLETY